MQLFIHLMRYFQAMSTKGSLHRRSKRGTPKDKTVWTLRVEAPRDPHQPQIRKQKAITFVGSRENAEEALARFVRSVRAGTLSDGQITFNELYSLWHSAESSRQRPRAATTSHHDELRYNRWLKPMFGERVVTTVAPLEIQRFYESIRRQKDDGTNGLSANSVVRIHALLAAMTNWAFREQIIDSNPMNHVKKPRAEVLPPRAPSKRDVEALLDHFWERDRTLWLAVRFP